MNLVMIDSACTCTPQAVVDGLAAAGIATDQLDVRVVADLDGGTAAKMLDESRGVGEFVILTPDRSRFANSFPNNAIAFRDDVDALCKDMAYVMTNFGREYKSQTRVFVTSDTHFWHSNIIKYCNRPFGSVEEMNEKMVEKWNEVVGKDDVVFHLGDFCFGGRKKVESIFPLLNGRIDLVLGNHDRLKIRDYYDMGFHRVYDRSVVYDSTFVLSHVPLRCMWDGGYCNVFGHVHDMPSYETCTRNSFCACVERHSYAPIDFNVVKRTVAALGRGK